jgi:hypothetical protein
VLCNLHQKEPNVTRTLVSTIAPPVSPFHAERLAIIDGEDYSGVERKVREGLGKQGITVVQDFLDEGVLALKQYYAVALLDPTAEHAVSDAIDPFWHAHILHTRQYISFGDRVFGQYVQHEPLNHADEARVRHVAGLYAYTGRVYRRLFTYINEAFYPNVMPDARLLCSHGEVVAQSVREQGLDIERLPVAV